MNISGLQDYYRITTTVRLSTDFYDASCQGRPPNKKLNQHIFTNMQDVLDIAPDLEPIIKILDKNDIAGKVGNYSSVTHGFLAFEGFTALKGARKEAGGVGYHSLVPSFKFQTFIPAECDAQTVEELLNAIANAHPWEHPMIEIEKISLWQPPLATGN